MTVVFSGAPRLVRSMPATSKAVNEVELVCVVDEGAQIEIAAGKPLLPDGTGGCETSPPKRLPMNDAA